jgi:hypothetical protein
MIQLFRDSGRSPFPYGKHRYPAENPSASVYILPQKKEKCKSFFAIFLNSQIILLFLAVARAFIV